MKAMIGELDTYKKTKTQVFDGFRDEIPRLVLSNLKKFHPFSRSNCKKYGTHTNKNTIFGKFWDAIENAVKAAYPDNPHLLDGVHTDLVFYTYIQLWTKSKLFQN
jgi:hypothetical protein